MDGHLRYFSVFSVPSVALFPLYLLSGLCVLRGRFAPSALLRAWPEFIERRMLFPFDFLLFRRFYRADRYPVIG
jgi:hypothetical protein